mmetsp:Transcript_49261/g.145453  ORF Transcript_49261/g.145453 Transcript_49261/m.145453 type:complete len:135 (+) Transcript_49261:72-476(+)
MAPIGACRNRTLRGLSLAAGALLLCSGPGFVAPPSGAVSGRRGAVGGLLAASFGLAANAADDFSALDKLLDKQFSVAQDETRCKTLEEGEQRGFCLAREYDEIECKKAKAEGKPCKAPTTKLGTSGGSYSAGKK